MSPGGAGGAGAPPGAAPGGVRPGVHAESVMGTVVTFDVRTPGAAPAHRAAIEAAVAWLHWVDATFSTYRADSEISRLDRGELAEEDCHPEVRAVLARCEALRRETGGYFDARAGGHLDPSGFVKGWSIERASTQLAAAGWPDHAVNGGGDIRLRGRAGAADAASARSWQVGLTHPFQLDAYCAALALEEGAVATSGTYERGWHVLDPHRGTPAMDLVAVTVVGAELATTDAYATAALAMGRAAPEWLASLPDHEAYVIDADGGGWETAGFGRYRRPR